MRLALALVRLSLVSACALALAGAGRTQAQPTGEYVTIPGLPDGSRLERLWSDGPGSLHVWGRSIDPGTSAPRATLYRWNGQAFGTALDLPGHEPGAVFAAGPSDVFAAAYDVAEGRARLFHFDGESWTEQPIAAPAAAHVYDLRGLSGDVVARADDGEILRHDGASWYLAQAGVGGPGTRLAYVDADETWVAGCAGQWVSDGAAFARYGETGACELHDVWGQRDDQGRLHLYAAGGEPGSGDLKVFRFREASTGSLTGSWETVVSDEGATATGGARGVWGTGPTDVYAAGSAGGEGRIYHFDGSWRRVTAFGELAPAHSVHGSGPDDVWITTGDRLLHLGSPSTLVCDDANVCTDDIFDGTACRHEFNTAPCEDGEVCTVSDACLEGACHAGAYDSCPDGNECTSDSCAPGTGCVHQPYDGPCDDGNACTPQSWCAAGTCVGEGQVTCPEDGNPCTYAVCIPSIGCYNDPFGDGMPCDDGNGCTENDLCQFGACIGSWTICDAPDACHDPGICDPSSGSCVSPPKPDGTPCSDGSACTQVDACLAGACVGADPVTCAAADACHEAGTCDPATGECVSPPKPDGTPCSDGSACTQVDACLAGACVGADPVTCAAADACHEAGSCDPATGECVSPPKPDGTPCDDGSLCTTADACAGGTCSGGLPLDCDDGNSCSVDSCAPGSGCIHQAADPSCEEPKTLGFYRRVCAREHPEEQMTEALVACVSDACAFAWIETVPELCAELWPDPEADKCQQAEAQLVTLLLNRCKGRIYDAEPLAPSACGTQASVGAAIAHADALLCPTERTFAECAEAQCEAEEINSGKALDVDSLRLESASGGAIRLSWSPPSAGARRYSVYRRPAGTGPFVKVAETADLEWVDAAGSPEGFDYEVTAAR